MEYYIVSNFSNTSYYYYFYSHINRSVFIFNSIFESTAAQYEAAYVATFDLAARLDSLD